MAGGAPAIGLVRRFRSAAGQPAGRWHPCAASIDLLERAAEKMSGSSFPPAAKAVLRKDS